MIIPTSLQKNDWVGLAAPARFLEKEKVKLAVNWLENLGLKVLVSSFVSESYNQFAGTDAQRTHEFQKMINNPLIKAIWCVRGGYGTARLLDKIDFSPLKENPKWIIGYSDVTALHAHLNRLGLASLHATMPVNFEENSQENLQYLQNVLFGKEIRYEWETDYFVENQQIEAEIIGGNLSVIYSLLGSVSAYKTKNKILLLEDLDEYYYHIDRMFLNLKRNGYFSDLKAVMIGGFTKIHDNTIPFGATIPQIVKEHCGNIPLIFNTPSGHIADNRPFVFGKKIKLQIEGKKITLIQ